MKIKTFVLFLLIFVLLVEQAGCQSDHASNREMFKRTTSTKMVKPVKMAYPPTMDKNVMGQNTPLQAKIENYLISCGVNGSVAIAKDNKMIFNRGLGYSNFKTGLKNQASTTYPIASITKAIVATSIMQLNQDGKLNIYDPVSKYIPNFPNGKRIELIHLLTHTSGIQRPKWHKGDSTTTDLMKEIESRRVRFMAGSKWDYQDANYMVLGYILEKVTGISLQDYIQKNIFDKANMVDSGFITSSLLTPISSVGYLKNGKSFNPIRVYNDKLLFGCGDIYSTANDLALFDQALIHGKLVSYHSLKEMLIPGSASTYGMGLYNKGNVIFSHGNLGGFESIHSFYKNGTSIAILLNVRDTSVNIFKTLSGIHQILIITGKQSLLN